MKKRFAVIVLSLCMVLALIPTAAFAADGDTIHVGGVALTGSEAEPAYALTDDSGSVTTEGAGESSYNIRWDGSTLTLNNATITQGYSQGYYIGAVTAISCGTDLKIELVGSNTVQGPDLTDEGAAETSGIYSEGSITISGTGTLDVRGGDITKTTGEGSAQSYGLYSGEEGNITISSGTVNAFGGDIDTVNGSASSSGISADGATVITGGKVTAAGGEITNNSGHAASIGIESYGGISIAGGSVEATGSSANVMGVNGNYAYSKGMYAYSGGISITGGSVEATGGSAEIISQDENATLYAESDGIDADNMNDSGGMSITGGSTVTATGGAAAVDGGDGIAYSYGISTGERITVEGSTVTATGGTAEGSEFSESYGIEHLEVIEISASTVTAYGEDEAILTDEPVRVSSGVSDQALEVKVGENAESAEEIGGSPFTEETDICHSIEGAKYFHSELVDPREPQPVEADVRVGDLQLTASVGSPAYALTDEDGSVTAEGAGESNYNIRWDGQTLTLRNATITEGACEFDDGEAAAAIYKLYGLAVELIGSNTVTGPSDGGGERDTFSSYGIFAEEGELTITGSGSLDVSGGNVAGENPVIFVESIGIGADGDIMITDTTVEAAGGTVSGDYAGSRGIESNDGVIITGSTVTASAGVGSVRADGIYAKDNITITDSQVTADGVSDYEKAPAYGGGIFSDAGNITISGEDTVIKAYSGYGQNGIAGISAEGGNITITDKADVTALAAVIDPYYEEGYSPVFTTADGGSVGDGIRAAGDIIIDDATVLALGCEANYSSGIFSETGDITIESGNVNAYGGRAVNHTDPESAGSAGISAEAGNVTINGGEVVAEVGLSEHGIADGIRAHADISIGGGKVTAAGALSSVDGVEPEYSGGIFSETGDITITGKDTVVEAGGGYAEKGSTAIGAEAGNLIIKDGKVRADGAYPVTSDTGFANGFSSVKADDGTGGNIIISGGDFEAIGYTDSVYCEGDLMASPDGTQITMKVLGELIFDIDSWEPDWDKMYDEAGEIEGSPFTSEMIVAADSTAGMQYFGGSSLAYDPAGDGTDDPAGSEDPGDASGQDSSNAKTSDDMNLIFWTILMLAGGCAATGIVACNRRKR